MDTTLFTRPLTIEDHTAALELYDVLHGFVPADLDPASFNRVLNHDGTQIIGAFQHNTLCAMVTLHILPNITISGRPYALIENVATGPAHREKGFARAAMSHAIDAAWAAECYKIMLLTGRASQAKGFYEKLGFQADEKWGMQLRRVPQRET